MGVANSKVANSNKTEKQIQNLLSPFNELNHSLSDEQQVTNVPVAVAEVVTPECMNNDSIEKLHTVISTPPILSYELFMWTWFVILSVLAIYDRFDWNVWPRQQFSIGSGSAGSDRLEGYKLGPWSVVLYDVVARISGRYSILCYNFLLLTRMKSLEDFLSGSFVSKYILDCTNMVNANIRLHTSNGIALCVLTLLHVWSILFPCIFHGYSATVVPGKFEWPLSERTPTKCKVEDFDGCWPGDANPDLKQMGLQVDDVFRMVEMTVFLAILMPLSVKWLSTHWHAAIQLHRIINIVYFVDIVRRHSHPHSWILNTPMFVLYLIDKTLYSDYWHRNNNPNVKKHIISKDFMVLYFKSSMGITNTVGPDYALRLKDSSFFEEKHVFTCFENRSKTNLGNEVDNNDWTVGVVIRVFRRERITAVLTDKVSHTQRIFDDEKCDILVTGPRQGEMSETIRYALGADDTSPVVIIGAGSAINFIIDTLQYCSINNNAVRRTNVALLYSTRDLDLFEWAHEALSSLVYLCENKDIKFKLTLACTSELEKVLSSRTIETIEAKRNALRKRNTLRNSRWFRGLAEKAADTVSFKRSRIDLGDYISEGCTVFCQGSAGLKDAVKSVCVDKKAAYYLGRGGSREDQV